MGAKDVLASWDGWFIVSQSKTTSWRARAQSKILSISACTSADEEKEHEKNSKWYQWIYQNFELKK